MDEEKKKGAVTVTVQGKQSVGFSDRVIAILRDKNGNVKVRYDSAEKSDCIVKGGMAQIAGLILTDIIVDDFDFIGIGTGAVAASKDDTGLGVSVKRKTADGTRQTTTETDDTAQLVAIFSKAADGLTGSDDITEVGAFTLVAGGVMLMRQVFDIIPCDWDAGDTLEMTVKVQAKQGA